MNRKELNMSKNTNNNQTVDEKKGKRTGLTILGYVLVIVALLTVLPVVLPPIFGYHTYLSGTDHTGNISKYGSVVYLKTIDEATYKDGNIVAIESADSSARRVDSYYVDSNDSSAKEIALRDGNGVILDTTKRAKSEKFTVNYNGNIGISSPTILPERCDSWQYAELINEITPDTYSPEDIQKFKDGSDPVNYPNVNAFDILLKQAVQTQHNVSASASQW